MTRRIARKATRTQSTLSTYVISFLLLLSVYFMILTVRIAHAPIIRAIDLVPIIMVALSFVVVRIALLAGGYQGDPVLPPLALLLSGLGLLLQYRMGSVNWSDLSKLAVFAYPLGWLMFVVVWMLFRNGRYGKLIGLALPSLFIACGVLAIILIFGQRFRGAVFLFGQTNPAELVKLFICIYLAGVVTDFRKPLQQTIAGIPAPPAQSIITLAVLWVIPMVLLLSQRDLGMIILLNLAFVVLVFMATGRWGYPALGFLAAVMAAYGAFQFFDHAHVRYLAWQNPFASPTGYGWQILQSLSAMFSGGLWGSGFGHGSPAVVPIAASDFIYAAIAEEFGFVGCVWLIVLYLLLFYRGYRIADQQKQEFARNLATALITMLAIQTLMNIGGVTKAIPLTGITLPLISYGGSSLVTTLIMLGLLAAISDKIGKR